MEKYTDEITDTPRQYSAGGLKRACIHLGDRDRAALRVIREKLDLQSNALAVRYSIRLLAKKLLESSK